MSFLPKGVAAYVPYTHNMMLLINRMEERSLCQLMHCLDCLEEKRLEKLQEFFAWTLVVCRSASGG